MITVDVLTTFPEMFAAEPPAVLGVSMPRRAIERGRLAVHATDIRAFADPPHHKTDDRPFGGGPGMVMLAEPLVRAVEHVERDGPPPLRILLTPQGEPLTQHRVESLANAPRLLLICGHYEGVDERAVEHLAPLELSLGDYILSAGELGALVLIDAVARLQPGVLGHADATAQDSFSPVPAINPDGSPIPARRRDDLLRRLRDEPAPPRPRAAPPDELRLLDCPHYTRPRVWRGREIPEVLLSGDHDRVAAWRIEQMYRRTRDRRPDLLDAHPDPTAT